MADQISQFVGHLESEMKKCMAEAEALIKDSRRDEANMLTIRANIFNIIAVVSQTAEKRFPQNTIPFIKEKIDMIPLVWKDSLLTAEKQGDHEKVMVERIKLQAIAEIDQKFMDILEKSE